MGTLVDRTERVFTDDDIARIAGTYHAWRGTASARGAGLKYENVPGFCYSASLEEVRKHDHALTPGRYVGAAESDAEDEEPTAEKIDRLTKKLFSPTLTSPRDSIKLFASSWSISVNSRASTTFAKLIEQRLSKSVTVIVPD